MRLPEQIVEDLTKTQEQLQQLSTKREQLMNELKSVAEYVNAALSGMN